MHPFPWVLSAVAGGILAWVRSVVAIIDLSTGVGKIAL